MWQRLLVGATKRPGVNAMQSVADRCRVVVPDEEKVSVRATKQARIARWQWGGRSTANKGFRCSFFFWAKQRNGAASWNQTNLFIYMLSPMLWSLLFFLLIFPKHATPTLTIFPDWDRNREQNSASGGARNKNMSVTQKVDVRCWMFLVEHVATGHRKRLR